MNRSKPHRPSSNAPSPRDPSAASTLEGSKPRSCLTALAAALGLALCWLTAPMLSASPSDLVREANLRRGASRAANSYGLDRIDRFNGNLVLSLDLGLRYPASGRFGYQFTLHYNSQIWDFVTAGTGQGQTVAARPVSTTNAGVGWDLSFGRLLAPTSADNPLLNWVFIDPDGTRHVLYDTVHPGDTPVAGVVYSRAGEYLRLSLRSDGRRELRHPSGRRHIFSFAGGEWRLDEFRDVHSGGLALAVAPDGSSWTVSDPHRSHSVFFKDDPNGTYARLLDRLELRAPHGATAVYAFEYTTVTLDRPAGDTDPATAATLVAPLLSRIVLPDGTDYLLSYHQSDPSSSGRLASLRLPTMGQIEWNYQAWQFPWLDCTAGANSHLADAVGIASRAMVNKTGGVVGTWAYSPYFDIARPLGDSCEQPKERRTKIADPLGHERNYYFSVYVSGDPTAPAGSWDEAEYSLPMTRRFSPLAGLALSEQLFEAGQLVRREYRSFELEPFNDCNGPCAGMGDRPLAHRTYFVDDFWHWKERAYSDYGGWGEFRTVTESSSFPGDQPTTTSNELSHDLGAWLLNQPTRSQRTRGSETRIVESCLDSWGDVWRQRRYAGTSPGAYDLIREMVYDSLGQPVANRYHGGDTDVLPTTGNLCAMVLPAPQYEVTQTWADGATASRQWVTAAGQPFLVTEDQTIDPNSAVPLASRDAAGYETSYDYDVMGRLTRQTPQEGGGRRWVHQAASATTRARTIIHDLGADGTTILARKQNKLDDFGRFEITLRTDINDGWDPATVWAYDALGHRKSERDPLYRTTSWLDFDPFGRARRIRPASGSQDDQTVTYVGDRREIHSGPAGYYLTDPSLNLVQESRSTTTDFDRDGRPVMTVDADGAITLSAYDLDGHLVSMSLERAGDVPVPLHQRSYDGRGFLVSSADADGNTTSFTGYDALGNRTLVEGQHGSLLREYDRAGRLVEVRGTNSGTLYERYIYGTANSGTNLRRGKLQRTERYNYGIAGVSAAAVVAEDNVYAGRGGRISQRTTSLLDGAAVRQSFASAATYDDLGQLASFSYPQCSRNWWMKCHTMARTVRYDRYAKNGRYLEAVVSQLNGGPEVRFVDQITYSDDGSLNKLWYGDDRRIYEVHTPHPTVRGGVQKASICSATSCNHFDWITYDATGALVRVDSGPNFPETETLLPVGVPSPAGSLPTTAELIDAIRTGGTAASSCPTYQYDELGAVVRISKCSGQVNPKHTDFVYDIHGRVLWKVGSNDGVTPLGYSSTWTLFDLSGHLVREIDKLTSNATWIYDSIYSGSRQVGHVTSWGPVIFEYYREYVHSDYAGRPFSKHTLENGALKSWVRW